MFAFFDVIVNFLSAIVGYFVSVIETIVYAIAFVVQGVSYSFSIIQFLPSWVLPFVFAIIAWSVINFLLSLL